MIEAKLFQHKTIKLGGVKFVIRKLTPSLFIDTEFFPISTISEVNENKRDVSEKQAESIIKEHKAKVKEIILKGVVEIKYFFKKETIDKYIDQIMDTTELYNALFVCIVNHSLGVKKNSILKTYKSIERLQLSYIN